MNAPGQKALQRRQPKQSRSEASKGLIVQAATELLSQEGFTKFSIRPVAKLAGLSVGTVYEYFPSKQALLFHVVEDRLKLRVDTLDGVLAECDLSQLPLRDVIEKCIDGLRDAGLYSRLDLEIRAAEDGDAKLKTYTEQYRSKLSERYIDLWRHYGSNATRTELEFFANYAHQLDTLSMKMQVTSPKNQEKVRQLNRKLLHTLADFVLED